VDVNLPIDGTFGYVSVPYSGFGWSTNIGEMSLNNITNGADSISLIRVEGNVHFTLPHRQLFLSWELMLA
jgi:hypothetical protein